MLVSSQFANFDYSTTPLLSHQEGSSSYCYERGVITRCDPNNIELHIGGFFTINIDDIGEYQLMHIIYVCDCWHFLAQSPSMEIESIPGNGTRNACWYFLATSLRFSKPQQHLQETPLRQFLTTTEDIHKRTDLSLYHFTRKYLGYRISYWERRYSSS